LPANSHKYSQCSFRPKEDKSHHASIRPLSTARTRAGDCSRT
jgi:hypothetical protein